MSESAAPIVIVGAGLAGLSAALAAAPAPVLLLDRGHAGDLSASVLAQGGIAAATGADDQPEHHYTDSLIAGGGIGDPELLHTLCYEATAAIAWLQAQGASFDRSADGQLARSREGGHHLARVVHAGGDATGARVHAALYAKAKQAAHIQFRQGCQVTALQISAERVCAVQLQEADGRRSRQPARAVVLACGGVGSLFMHRSTPAGADGSGLALAIAAGADSRDLELIQFHPTALDCGSHQRAPLITEALRGAGARLIRADGTPLMTGLHPLLDLAPRDIVARAVDAAHRRDGRVWLDARNITDVAATFPSVLAICQAHGLDPRQQPIPVRAAVHFHMGGIASDGEGRTARSGLYAVGEAAGNGVHGGNRLASNSLLECVVFGRRLGAALRELPSTPLIGAAPSTLADPGDDAEPAALAELRALLWSALGPVRRTADMAAAVQRLRSDVRLRDSRQGRVAQHLLAAALARPHSLGAHYLADADQ